MERVFRCLLTFLLCLVAAMECLQVLLRYILEMPIMWLDESIIFPAVWLYMLGCANASRENTQIVAKILPVFFSGPRQTAFFDLCAQCFSAVISCWLTWYAVEYFFYTFEADRKTGYLFLPMTIGETALCAGMLLVTWYTLLQLARSARRMRALLQKGKPLCS
ncbi:MAG: TRAP transporter small permease subunit [Desulfovibrio sp.]|uniref:TRAP transporter small permease n=1 Tax=Desulfovibrio porci TaxID=2605782 RepID=A0A6L5XJV5_9BACT|nr:MULTISPECIES: TRAP transporter small permease subunit [Desulfovibrio]MCD7983463.1 TRAP transporter small permease subunit [Desulfovibrio sp.]MDY3809835.1 TRAP transporter small permease subunit [Desulfovibrio porci]MSS27490.1 TRAP transporter small permease [Desulfovibrio porci]